MADGIRHFIYCDKCKQKLLDKHGNVLYYLWYKDAVSDALSKGWLRKGNKIYHKECAE